MKIDQVIENVPVVRYSTIAEALTKSLGGSKLAKTASSFILSTLHLDKQTEAEQELAEILRQPLVREYEGETTYTRTMALASLEREMGVHEFFQKLAESNYYPASFSEDMAYVAILSARGEPIDTIFHLGTFLRDERYRERRLLSRKDGSIELIPFFPATKLKSYYHVVVVQDEKHH